MIRRRVRGTGVVVVAPARATSPERSCVELLPPYCNFKEGIHYEKAGERVSLDAGEMEVFEGEEWRRKETDTNTSRVLDVRLCLSFPFPRSSPVRDRLSLAVPLLIPKNLSPSQGTISKWGKREDWRRRKHAIKINPDNAAQQQPPCDRSMGRVHTFTPRVKRTRQHLPIRTLVSGKTPLTACVTACCTLPLTRIRREGSRFLPAQFRRILSLRSAVKKKKSFSKGLSCCTASATG